MSPKEEPITRNQEGYEVREDRERFINVYLDRSRNGEESWYVCDVKYFLVPQWV